MSNKYIDREWKPDTPPLTMPLFTQPACMQLAWRGPPVGCKCLHTYGTYVWCGPGGSCSWSYLPLLPSHRESIHLPTFLLVSQPFKPGWSEQGGWDERRCPLTWAPKCPVPCSLEAGNLQRWKNRTCKATATSILACWGKLRRDITVSHDRAVCQGSVLQFLGAAFWEWMRTLLSLQTTQLLWVAEAEGCRARGKGLGGIALPSLPFSLKKSGDGKVMMITMDTTDGATNDMSIIGWKIIGRLCEKGFYVSTIFEY